ADRCFGEFHCLKEWLVERLLEDGQARRCSSGDDGIESCWPHLGEGDLCAEEDSAEDRALRTAKLCGRLTPSLSPDVEAAVKQEVLQLLQRALPREDTGWEAASDVSQRFGQLQAPGLG
ncbi:PLCXD2, partial [Symbiodinium necroappetens]